MCENCRRPSTVKQNARGLSICRTSSKVQNTQILELERQSFRDPKMRSTSDLSSIVRQSYLFKLFADFMSRYFHEWKSSHGQAGDFLPQKWMEFPQGRLPLIGTNRTTELFLIERLERAPLSAKWVIKRARERERELWGRAVIGRDTFKLRDQGPVT